MNTPIFIIQILLTILIFVSNRYRKCFHFIFREYSHWSNHDLNHGLNISQMWSNLIFLSCPISANVKYLQRKCFIDEYLVKWFLVHMTNILTKFGSPRLIYSSPMERGTEIDRSTQYLTGMINPNIWGRMKNL